MREGGDRLSGVPDHGTPLLALRGIEKRFGAVNALAGVDFDVRAGEVVALAPHAELLARDAAYREAVA